MTDLLVLIPDGPVVAVVVATELLTLLFDGVDLSDAIGEVAMDATDGGEPLQPQLERILAGVLRSNAGGNYWD
jgi:hypothetical protein